jgi:xanthine dehydrogenase YagS FAD-binding subunit
MSFGYIKAATAEQALTACGALADARLLAGGTNLLDLIKYGVEQPSALIDIRKLPLDAVEVKDDGLVRIGALATNTAVVWHPVIRARFPVLSEAILAGATPQLRNAATVAGNMLQNSVLLLLRHCAAVQQAHVRFRLRVITASTPSWERATGAFAVHPSDMSVALAALDVLVNISALNGSRQIPFADLHRLPDTTPQIETILEPGELITSIEIGPADFGARSHYRKVRDRESYEVGIHGGGARYQ